MFKWLRRTPRISMPKDINVFSRKDLKSLMDLNLVFDFTDWEVGPVEYKGFGAPSDEGIVICPVCGRRAMKQDEGTSANFLHRVKITQAEFVSCKKEKPEVEEEKCVANKNEYWEKWVPVQQIPLLHKQTVFEPGKGDCLRTCVACLFHLPLEAVPNFAEKSKKKMTDAFWDWVEKRGFKIEYKIGAEPINYGYHILSGMGPRGVRHSVITSGDQFFHDPHPDNMFLLPHEDKPKHRWIWYSITGVGPR